MTIYTAFDGFGSRFQPFLVLGDIFCCAVKPFVEIISAYNRVLHFAMPATLKRPAWHLRTGFRLSVLEQAGKRRTCPSTP